MTEEEKIIEQMAIEIAAEMKQDIVEIFRSVYPNQPQHIVEEIANIWITLPREEMWWY